MFSLAIFYLSIFFFPLIHNQDSLCTSSSAWLYNMGQFSAVDILENITYADTQFITQNALRWSGLGWDEVQTCPSPSDRAVTVGLTSPHQTYLCVSQFTGNSWDQRISIRKLTIRYSQTNQRQQTPTLRETSLDHNMDWKCDHTKKCDRLFEMLFFERARGHYCRIWLCPIISAVL